VNAITARLVFIGALAASMVCAGIAISPQPSAALTPSADDPAPAAVRAAAVPAGSSIMAKDASDATLSHYYVWDGVTAAYRGPRDRHGVILTPLGTHGQIVYNPVAVAEWGIHHYENWLHTGKVSERTAFLAQAKWLRDVMDSKGRFPYRYLHFVRGIKPPWYSAMAQGLGISVLLRAYQATGDISYMRAADRAVWPFGRDVQRGGVVTGGGKWLEEYPDSKHVLNGSIFAAFGLWDMMRVQGRAVVSAESTATPTQAEGVWDAFTSNLALHLSSYESRGAILYELGGAHFSRIPYYDVHVRQLRALAQITGDTRFSDTASSWAGEFRAYPAPVIGLASRPRRAAGYRCVSGKVRFLYLDYYGRRPRAVIRLVGAGGATTRVASVPMSYGASREVAWFRWLAPVSTRAATYRVTIDKQPSTGYRALDYPQHSSMTFTISGTGSR
jgi:hypothetical protein